MKRIISSALVIMLTVGAAGAQTTEGQKKHHNKEQKSKAFDQLNLTADQKARMQTLREEFKKGMSDLKANQQLSDEERRARRKTLHEQFRSQSEAILTQVQKEQLSKMKAERKEAHKTGQWKKDGRGKTAGRGGFEKLQQELNLTTDQQSKMSNLRSEYKTKFEALRNDKAISEDQKKAKMHELATQQFDQMKAVLTPDQIQKLESMRGQRKQKSSK